MVRSARRALALGLLGTLACGAAPRGGFDGERAFADLAAQVEIGPRPAGSRAAKATRALIRERLRRAGWPVREQGFRVERRDGSAPVAMTNLIAERKGRSGKIVLVGAHYDTKAFSAFEFVGANDGASGTALLLELARVLGSAPGEATLWLCFFDGEEAFGRDITARDGLYGSSALARAMQQDGTLARIHALVLVDMVADRDLNLAVDRTSSPGLRARLQELAARAGFPRLVDPSAELALIDDHTPFLRHGVRHVLALIDFQFGAREMPGPFWHTARDDLQAVSADSLNRVGSVVVQLLASFEAEI